MSTVAALPLVAWQGYRVRRTLNPAPAPTDPNAGVTGPDPTVRLAVIGESTAAGCGVDTFEDSIAAALARDLAERLHENVSWFVLGQDGATSRRILHRLLPDLPGGWDLVVLLAGVNDVLSRRPPAEWGANLEAILDGLEARSRRVVVAGLPTFTEFPQLPGALSRYLDRRARALDRVAEQVCRPRDRTVWVGSEGMDAAPGFFAVDGFHPSAEGYRQWANWLCGRLFDSESRL
ncbi:MAG TPA: SGNH/GDSL hydrolase family protein [Actinomycetales bacterium]|nr:SGNH/GDSL hydrolase family protein [Actinomycetales bacterium]